MKFNLRRLILVLLSIMIFSLFQNCRNNKNNDLNSIQNCSNAESEFCDLKEPVGEKLNIALDNSEISFKFNMQNGEYSYKIIIANDLITNSLNSSSCTLKQNSSWQSLKQKYLINGICSYNFKIPDNYVRCMAMTLPFGEVKDLSSDQSINLSNSICQQDYFNICGEANAESFQKDLELFIADLDANKGCDL